MPKNKGNSGWRLKRDSDGSLHLFRIVRGSRANKIEFYDQFAPEERGTRRARIAEHVNRHRPAPTNTEEAS